MKNRTLNLARLFIVPAALAAGFTSVGLAQETEPEPDTLVDALTNGKLDFNLRVRAEWVDQDGLMDANAYTERIRIGYGTRPFQGLSFYIGFEDLRSFDYDNYNAAGLNGQPGRAVVADPEDTELNEAYVKFDWEKHATTFIAGRQRLTLDDHRFVGNVGWRQLEQTFDAVTIKNSSLEDLAFTYSYLWEINRIFGPDANADFESDSHIFNVAYTGIDFGKLVGFAYLLDFDNSAANSSNSIGVRFEGKHELSDETRIDYILSFANQSDAGDNPTDYDANYYLAQASLWIKDKGSIGGGFEVLGSDDGLTSFRTPLATLHKFNGWADVFLATPTAGLQDLYIFAKTTLPWEIKGGVYYHFFDAEDGGGDFGEELDIVLSKKLSDQWSVTAKFANFDGDDGFADRTKIWLQTTFKF